MTAPYERHKIPWSDAGGFKEALDAKDPAFQYLTSAVDYSIWFDEGFDRYYCVINFTEDAADKMDFDDNYKVDGGQGPLSGEHPLPVTVGINKKRDRTVNGNNITCPSGSNTTLCSRVVKAGKNILIEKVILSKDDLTLATVTVKDTTNGVVKRKYWLDAHTTSIPDRIFIKNENGGADKTIALIIKHTKGSDIKASGVLICTRTK